MKKRLPIVLSLLAVVIALLGSTPLGEAAVSIARYALNADKVDGIHASRRPRAGRLLALNRSVQYPRSVLPSFTSTAYSITTVSDSAGFKTVSVQCPSGRFAAGGGGVVNVNRTSSTIQPVVLTGSEPSAFDAGRPRAWTAEAEKTDRNFGGFWSLTGYVICGR